MKKEFSYNDTLMTIEKIGYGSYRLYSGETMVAINDSEIYDWCDDDSDPEKHEQAKREAYGYITRAYEASL